MSHQNHRNDPAKIAVMMSFSALGSLVVAGFYYGLPYLTPLQEIFSKIILSVNVASLIYVIPFLLLNRLFFDRYASNLVAIIMVIFFCNVIAFMYTWMPDRSDDGVHLSFVNFLEKSALAAGN